MGFAKSGDNSIYKRRAWKKRLEEQTDRPACGHVWKWDPEDRLMRCYKCGLARLATDVDRVTPRVENGPTEF